jgi:D-beta-D-heptose 7-phosphate kinase/D-beta-D-heptose 1-phosphate adenosyltransferase
MSQTYKVLVIGESCTDIFIYGTSERKSPEGSGPVFVPYQEIYGAGMAANVANNLGAMGIDVDIHTDTGNITKSRYVNKNTNELYLRVDEGDVVEGIKISELPDLNEYNAIVISDYCKGFLSEEDINTIASAHPLVILDTKKKLGDWCKDVTYIKINRLEWEVSKDVIRDNEWLFDKIICTLDKTGTAYKHTTYAVKPIENADVSGAGDTFVAGFVTKYLDTNDIEESIQWANYCAGEVVKEKGVSVFKNKK